MTPRTLAIFSNNYETRELDSPTLQTKDIDISTNIQDLIPTSQENKTISKESTKIEIETNAKLNTTTTRDGNQARVSSRSNKGTHNNPFIKEHFVSYTTIVV